MAGRRYNPSVTALKSLIAVPAPLTQGSREVRSIAAVRGGRSYARLWRATLIRHDVSQM